MLSVLSIFFLAITINLIEMFSTESTKNEKEGFNYTKALLIIISEFIFSVIMTFDKWLMTNKFFSAYKVCISLGIVEFFISLINLIIVSFIPCSFNDKCPILYKGNYYIDNIFAFFDDILKDLAKQIFLLFVYIVLMGTYNVFLVITVKYFTPTHAMITIIIGKFARYLNSYWSESRETQITIEGIPAFFTVLAYVIIFFFLLVYLEIIELNCFNLNYNTFYNINKRSHKESVSGMKTMRLLSHEGSEQDYDEEEISNSASINRNHIRNNQESSEYISNEYSSTYYKK